MRWIEVSPNLTVGKREAVRTTLEVMAKEDASPEEKARLIVKAMDEEQTA